MVTLHSFFLRVVTNVDHYSSFLVRIKYSKKRTRSSNCRYRNYRGFRAVVVILVVMEAVLLLRR